MKFKNYFLKKKENKKKTPKVFLKIVRDKRQLEQCLYLLVLLHQVQQ